MKRLSDIKGLLPERKGNFTQGKQTYNLGLENGIKFGYDMAITDMDKTIDRDRLVEIIAWELRGLRQIDREKAIADQIISKMGEWIR